MKKLGILFTMVSTLIITSCSNPNNDNLESTAYTQASIKVTKDVKKNGLDDVITIKFGKTKCTNNKNITPTTINSDTDDCVASWKSDGGSNPLDPNDCMYHDSYVYLEFYNSSDVHVGTVYFYESNSSSYKLKSSQGENGYVIVTKMIDNIERNSSFTISIEPELV